MFKLIKVNLKHYSKLPQSIMISCSIKYCYFNAVAVNLLGNQYFILHRIQNIMSPGSMMSLLIV